MEYGFNSIGYIYTHSSPPHTQISKKYDEVRTVKHNKLSYTSEFLWFQKEMKSYYLRDKELLLLLFGGNYGGFVPHANH